MKIAICSIVVLLVFLFARCGTAPTPAHPLADTTWRMLIVGKGEIFWTAVKYINDTSIKNGKQVINIDTIYKVRTFYTDSLGRLILDSLTNKPYERWDTVPNALVGIKVK